MMEYKHSPPRQKSNLLGTAVVLGCILTSIIFRLIDYGNISDILSHRRMSTKILYLLSDAEEYSQMQRTYEIDRTIEERAQKDDSLDQCSNILLYLPDAFADHGHGSQINTYTMGINTATYLNRAMVLLEPPLESSNYASGSQFGCPVDAFKEMKETSLRGDATWKVREDFPLGFSRLVDHPVWLSHGCEVPCKDTHQYRDWHHLAMGYKSGEFNEITCKNPDGTITNVVVTTGSRLRKYFREHEALMTRDHPSSQARQWALNLGATPQEADVFSNIKGSTLIWDYVLGLMNKAGFFKLQPWIARDLEMFLRTYDLPMHEEYSAIHVRRGDKLVKEARSEVINYWKEQGYTDQNDLPTNYVPFVHYLSQWDGPESCPEDDSGKIVVKHNVYVATDDPIVVRQEITELPGRINENTVIWNGCHELTFFFNPSDNDTFHLSGHDGDRFEAGLKAKGGDNCFARYHRNIVSMADMMILSKAKTFVGEYNSNWGRVIRTMRVRLNSPVAQDDGVTNNMILLGGDSDLTMTKVLDTRIAWGETIARAPGF